MTIRAALAVMFGLQVCLGAINLAAGQTLTRQNKPEVGSSQLSGEITTSRPVEHIDVKTCKNISLNGVRLCNLLDRMVRDVRTGYLCGQLNALIEAGRANVTPSASCAEYDAQWGLK